MVDSPGGPGGRRYGQGHTYAATTVSRRCRFESCCSRKVIRQCGETERHTRLSTVLMREAIPESTRVGSNPDAAATIYMGRIKCSRSTE